MAKREKVGIIFMSSIVSFQGVPHIANYAASKAYDLIFAEGVAAELKPYNVDVTAVQMLPKMRATVATIVTPSVRSSPYPQPASPRVCPASTEVPPEWRGDHRPRES